MTKTKLLFYLFGAVILMFGLIVFYIPHRLQQEYSIAKGAIIYFDFYSGIKRNGVATVVKFKDSDGKEFLGKVTGAFLSDFFYKKGDKIDIYYKYPLPDFGSNFEHSVMYASKIQYYIPAGLLMLFAIIVFGIGRIYKN